MTATWERYFRGATERGTATLPTIDAAEARKYLTVAEATRCRAYWRDLYEVRVLAAEVVAGRSQVVTWESPNLNVGPVVEVRRIAGAAERVVHVLPADRRAVFAGDVGEEEIVVGFDVVVVAANGARGPVTSTSVTVLAVPPPPPPPEPEPTPELEPESAAPEPAPTEPAPTEPAPTEPVPPASEGTST